MKQTVFEIIQERISTISSNAVKTFNNAKGSTNFADDLYRLGFTESVSVVKDYEKLDKVEALRARLINYFGNGMVLNQKELTKFEKQYNLITAGAGRFKDAIPYINQKEIVEFSKILKENKWNQGRVETELYHIPVMDDFLVTAPKECFRKALSTSEMTRDEYLKWLEEDPIVWKRIFKFNPQQETNTPTEWFRRVTAWGLEEVLINRN